MQVLQKYKKKFDVGFKEFVLNLDLFSSKVVKEILFNGFLEDPVYIKWALENRLGFEHFLKIGKDDVIKVYRSLPNPGMIFLRALKGHPEEKEFISASLPSFGIKQYFDSRDMEKVTISQQEDARIKIMQIIFELKEKGELPFFDWKLPPATVLNGTSHELDKLGNFNQYYEDKTLALTGKIEKGKRSGEWISFFPTGAIYAQGNYQEGQKAGEWRVFYANGNLKAQGPFRDDLKNGEWLEFEPNQVYKTVQYANGRKC